MEDNNFRGIVYTFINKLNNKRYIGITSKTLDERIKTHLYTLNSKTSGGSYLHNAIKKYGIENFDIKQIDAASSVDELKEKEKFWIHFFDTSVSGYNLTIGGDGVWGYRHTPEAIEKIRQANLGKNNHRYGMTMSEEHKRILSERNSGSGNYNYGRIRSQEHIDKAKHTKILNGGTTGSRNPMYGRHHSDESKEKIRRNRKAPSGESHVQSKIIYALDSDGNIIHSFINSKDAACFLNKSRSMIYEYCQKQKIVNGYKWMYQNDYNNLVGGVITWN